MKRFGICVLGGLVLRIFHYFNYTSLSEPIEVSPDLCDEAQRGGKRCQNFIDLKTLYPLTEPIYFFHGDKVYQLNALYHDGRSMVCLEYEKI